MAVTELARAVAPRLEHEIVGIRPGEKLHEVLITEDDARVTVELDDRYIICPPLVGAVEQRIKALGGRPVSEGFRYSSDGNSEWLDADSLRALNGQTAR
jgi:UDP-N-acetylglucosamine 4,6-dehydratase